MADVERQRTAKAAAAAAEFFWLVADTRIRAAGTKAIVGCIFLFFRSTKRPKCGLREGEWGGVVGEGLDQVFSAKTVFITALDSFFLQSDYPSADSTHHMIDVTSTFSTSLVSQSVSLYSWLSVVFHR